MKRTTFISSLAIGGVISQRGSHGQTRWTPVTAKIRHATFVVNADGTETPFSLDEGYYYRVADGSDIRYTRQIIDGIPQGPGRGFLRDTATATSYNVYFGSKKAIVNEKWKAPTRERLPYPQSSVVRGQQVVNGLPCVGTLLKVTPPNRDGIMWKSIEHDLTVRIDYTMSGYHTVIDLHEIQIGVEPPVGAVSLPPDFEVLDHRK